MHRLRVSIIREGISHYCRADGHGLISIDLPPTPAAPEVLEYSDAGLVEGQEEAPAEAAAVDLSVSQYITWGDDDAATTQDDSGADEELPDYLTVGEAEDAPASIDASDDVAAFGDELFLEDDDDLSELDLGSPLEVGDEESDGDREDGGFEEEEITFIADMDEIEDLRSRVRTFLDERLESSDLRGHHKGRREFSDLRSFHKEPQEE